MNNKDTPTWDEDWTPDLDMAYRAKDSAVFLCMAAHERQGKVVKRQARAIIYYLLRLLGWKGPSGLLKARVRRLAREAAL